MSAEAAARLSGERPLARPLRQTLTWRVLFVVLALVGLWSAARVLSHAAHEQRLRRGAEHARAGTDALQTGRHDEAVVRLREAVALVPARPAYRVALAKALVALGRSAEAEPYVLEALTQDPVDGEANLVHGRVLRQAGQVEEAERAYFRAIYGRWTAGQEPLRRASRLELVSLFRQTGQRARLRAALVELSTAFPGDRRLQLQAGQELLEAGFPDDAARQLRGVVERFADPGEALALLARAEFARGRYVQAYAAAGRAVAQDRRDEASAALRSLAARVLSLDPDQPRLTARERLRRIRVLVAEARARLTACVVPAPAPVASPSLVPLLDRWLAQRRADADLGRALLAAAADAVRSACPPPGEQDAIGIVLAGLEGAAS